MFLPQQLILKPALTPYPPRTQWGHCRNLAIPLQPRPVVNATAGRFRRTQPPTISSVTEIRSISSIVRLENMHNFPNGDLAAATFAEFIRLPMVEIIDLSSHAITKPIYEERLLTMCLLMGKSRRMLVKISLSEFLFYLKCRTRKRLSLTNSLRRILSRCIVRRGKFERWCGWNSRGLSRLRTNPGLTRL